LGKHASASLRPGLHTTLPVPVCGPDKLPPLGPVVVCGRPESVCAISSRPFGVSRNRSCGLAPEGRRQCWRLAAIAETGSIYCVLRPRKSQKSEKKAAKKRQKSAGGAAAQEGPHFCTWEEIPPTLSGRPRGSVGTWRVRLVCKLAASHEATGAQLEAVE